MLGGELQCWVRSLCTLSYTLGAAGRQEQDGRRAGAAGARSFCALVCSQGFHALAWPWSQGEPVFLLQA